MSYEIKVDLTEDVIELFGVRYALSVFRTLGIANPGEAFRLVSRYEDGTIVMERLPEPQSSAHDAAHSEKV